MWLRDTGVLSKLKDVISPPYNPIPYPKARHKQPLTIYQLSITMILFVVGITLSLLTFIRELLKRSGRKGNKATNETIELIDRDALSMRLAANSKIVLSDNLPSGPRISSHGLHGRTVVVNHKWTLKNSQFNMIINIDDCLCVTFKCANKWMSCQFRAVLLVRKITYRRNACGMCNKNLVSLIL